MDKKERLLQKLFLDQCSKEELEELLQLLEHDSSSTGPEIMIKLFDQLHAKSEVDKGVSDRIFEKIEKGVEAVETKKISKTIAIESTRKKWYRWVGRAAVVLLLISAFGISQFFQFGKEIIQQTAYGEIKEFYLPDSSLVVLNGNSQISFVKKWQNGATRVVHLEGEAYFKVRNKLISRDKFQVVTNDLTVEVLGTAFNVNTHKNETKVYLEEGRIKVNLDHQTDKVIDLVPGEAIRYSTAKHQLKAPSKNPHALQPNWREGFTQFKDTPLQEILEELSQAHELEFQISKPELANTLFTITLPTKDMDETMRILGRSIEASILKDNDRFVIEIEPHKKE